LPQTVFATALATALTASLAVTLLAAAPASALDSVVISKFAGTGLAGLPVEGPALGSGFNDPQATATDAHGNVYVADFYNNAVEKITPNGTLSVIAGVPADVPSYGAPTPGKATESHLFHPDAVAVDGAGNVYIADENLGFVEKVTPSGTLSIFAGGGAEAPSTTPQSATNVKLFHPRGLVVDPSGDVYVSDASNHVVEEITPEGMLSVIAGKDGEYASHITAGPATATDLKAPEALALDASGNLYICDAGQNALLKLTPEGSISRLAGSPTGAEAAPTLGGPAVDSSLAQPDGVAVDGNGDIYLSDSYSFLVEEINTQGTLTAIAGTGVYGSPTYGAVATETDLSYPGGLALGPDGVLYIVEYGAEAVDRIGTVQPSSPREVTATLSGGTLSISFLPPITSGSSPITEYEVSTDGGATWHTVSTAAQAGEGLGASVSGLTGGPYEVEVRAVNSSGPGAASANISLAGTPSTSSGPSASATSTKKQAQCLSSRKITLHWLTPRGTKTGRVTVTVAGRLYRTLPASARSVTVSFAGRSGPAPVTVIVSTRARHGHTLRTERALHICTPAIATQSRLSLYLAP
jgi:sugar lactone lactonase YvrE